MNQIDFEYEIEKTHILISIVMFTLLPENPMNSSSRITRAGNKETIKLNVPTPIRTPLSK